CFEPMFVEFDIDGVRGRALIARPHVFLDEAHSIEDLLGSAFAAIGEFLRVAERATDPLDHARLAADVVRRPDMTRRIAASNVDRGPDREARRHGLPTFGPSGRFSMSASLARTSS